MCFLFFIFMIIVVILSHQYFGAIVKIKWEPEREVLEKMEDILQM